MNSTVPSETAHGLPVGTAAHVPADATVTLGLREPDESVVLSLKMAVEMFAVGLQTAEPDRTGWVAIAELQIDDHVTFAVGTTTVDSNLALEAVRRGVELAIATGLARIIEGADDATKEDASGSDLEH